MTIPLRQAEADLVQAPARRFTYPASSQFLSQAVVLEEASPPRLAAATCYATFLLVAAAVLVATLVKIDVFSTAVGRLAPVHHNQVIQAFERGIVAELLAEEGQLVEAGVPLLRLAMPEVEADVAQLQLRQAALKAKSDRLQALAFAAGGPAIGGTNDAVNDVRRDQAQIMPLHEAAASAEQQLVAAEIGRLERMHQQQSVSRAASAQELKLALANLDIKRRLQRKGLTIGDDMLASERGVLSLKSALARQDADLIDVAGRIDEAQRQLARTIAAAREQRGDQLAEVRIELADLKRQLELAQDRLARGSIKAPLRGIIHGLAIERPGAVVEPAEVLLELVPLADGLVAEIRLPTSEIAHVAVGQPVKIAIDGLEPQRYGFVTASLSRLSPTTFVDEKGLPFYRGTVLLAQEQLVLGDRQVLMPGMTLTAQIKIDERTILEYLLKPIYRAWDQAFHER